MPDTVHLGSGKVRELYALGDDRLLLVASDRISTFDVVLPTEIPDKGRVLTGLAAFWFAQTRAICPNHLLALRPDGRSTECRRLTMLPIECVVRGYLAGSGWKDYRTTGEVCGTGCPPGSSSRTACRSRSSRRPPRRRPVTTRTSRARTPRGSWAPRRSPPPSASRSSSTASPRGTRSTAASSSPTRSSSSAPTRRAARPGRRGAHARLVAVLAGRPVHARRSPAVLRQAVRARFLRADGLEQDLPGPRAAPRRRRGDAGALRRGLRAHHRDRLRRLPGRPLGRPGLTSHPLPSGERAG